jgi:hypothetical protein
MKPTVLIATTSRWFPTARLGIALAKVGFEVKTVCPSRHPLGVTTAVRGTHRYDGLAPLWAFAAAIDAVHPDLIIASDDLALLHLHKLYDRAERRGQAGLATCALIERSLGAPASFPVMRARASVMAIAKEEGVRAPATEVISNISDLRRWSLRMGFPTILKTNSTSGGEGVRIVRTLEEAERAFWKLQAPPLLSRAAKRALIDQDPRLVWPTLLRKRSVVNAQAFVAGRDATSTVACWQGSILASLHFEVLNKHDSTGPSTVLRIIENTDMSTAAERIVRRLNLSGVVGLDFILEEGTTNAHLIEINPRATQVGHLALGPGHDIPAALYAAVTGETIREAPKVTDHDTITLFPHEWLRNPASSFLKSSYHDVPWEEPELIRACVSARRKEWTVYSREVWVPTLDSVRVTRK